MTLHKAQKEKIVSEFGIHGKDTGSASTQVAMLTERINELTEHCKTHHKDFSTKRGLLKMVCHRRGLLRYLATKDETKYKDLIQRLGLRK